MPVQTVLVQTTVSVSAATAWNAFTTPEDITQWNFALESWCCPSAKVDLRIGGQYNARMEAKDGSMGFDFVGVYEEIVPNRVIALVMPDGRKSRTTFDPVEGGTKISTEFDAETDNSLEQQRDGWQAILDNFKMHVERKR